MEPISLILAALLAGAAKGVGKTAAKAVEDAYNGLRDALKRRLADKPAAQDAVEQYAAAPEDWQGNLELHLRQAKADQDQAVLDAASSLLRLTDPAGASTGKYNVNLAGAQGVQLGDHNRQSNVFNAPPSPPAG
jgi:hypothetical protein